MSPPPPPPPPYFEFAVGFIAVVYVFETYLDWRQYRKNLERERPVELRDIVTHEQFAKAQAYARDKAALGFVSSFASTAKSVLMLVYGALPFLWRVAADVAAFAGVGDSEIVQSLVFVLLSSVVDTLFGLPFSLYSTFVVEEKHGFNKSTLSLFFTDLLKMYGIGMVLGAPLLAAMISVVQQGGEYFYFYVWLLVSAFQLLMLAIYPNVIQPLFNKVTPLEESPLKQKIEALASKLSFPLKKLYMIDGSKRSGHSNAYFYGFFKNKHIVLFDTLVKQMSEEEVVAVLGHELGHWQMSHMPKNLVIIETHLFVLFYLFGQFLHNGDMYSAFGFDTHPVIIGLTLFQLMYSPIEHVLDFLTHVLSRKFEFEADAFAKRLGYGRDLRSGLIKLQLENLGNMNPDPLFSAFHYSHPPLVERLKALGKTE